MSRSRRVWNEVAYKPGVEVTVEPIEGAAPSIKSAAKTVRENWQRCAECGKEIWSEFGKEYYHLLACSKSNGIGYYDGERTQCCGRPIKEQEAIMSKVKK